MVEVKHLCFKVLSTCLFLLILFSQLVFGLMPGESKVSDGNLKHLNEAFKKLAISDGYVAETWSIIIGKSIIHNPVNFLKAYKKNKSFVTRLDALVGNLGPEFVDDFKRQAVEIRRRIASLKAINDNELKPFSEECISQLRRQLKVVERPLARN